MDFILLSLKLVSIVIKSYIKSEKENKNFVIRYVINKFRVVGNYEQFNAEMKST